MVDLVNIVKNLKGKESLLAYLIRNYDLNEFDTGEPVHVCDDDCGCYDDDDDDYIEPFKVLVLKIDKQHFINKKKNDSDHFNDTLYGKFIDFYFTKIGGEKKIDINTSYEEFQDVLSPIKDIKKFVLENNLFYFFCYDIECSTVLFSLIENPDTKCFAAYTHSTSRMSIFTDCKKVCSLVEECFYLIEDFSTLTVNELICFDHLIEEDTKFVNNRRTIHMLERGADPNVFKNIISEFRYHKFSDNDNSLIILNCEPIDLLNKLKENYEGCFFDRKKQNFIGNTACKRLKIMEWINSASSALKSN